MPLQQTERQAKQAAGTSAAPGSDPGADTMCFRAATLDEAIAVAEHSLGTRVRVVAANRIRRGGIGGFFASDLGVEVTVALDEETIEQALERLVAETAADEREQWLGHERQDTVTLSGRADTPMPSVVHPPSAERDRRDDTVTAPAPAPGRAAGPTMVRVEQIIEELQALTAAPLFGDERVRPTFARMRREAEERAEAAAARAAAVAQPVAQPVIEPVVEPVIEPVVEPVARQEELPVRQVVAIVPPARPSFPPSPGEIAKAAAAAAAAKSHTFRRELRTPSAVVDAAEPVEPAQQMSTPETALEPTPARPASSSAPSRRQVELAVAAADQLIESLKHDDGVKRLSVRVVLRTGDQREVEAEAEWEA
jgi:hypothetical protein